MLQQRNFSLFEKFLDYGKINKDNTETFSKKNGDESVLPVSFNRLDFIMYMILLIEIFKKAEDA